MYNEEDEVDLPNYMQYKQIHFLEAIKDLLDLKLPVKKLLQIMFLLLIISLK